MKRICYMLLLLVTGGFVQGQDIASQLEAYCKAAESTGTFHGTVMVNSEGDHKVEAKNIK